jgi:hypothetical protein
MFLDREGENRAEVLTEIEDENGGRQLFKTIVTVSVQTTTSAVGRLVKGDDAPGITAFTTALSFASDEAIKVAREVLLHRD